MKRSKKNKLITFEELKELVSYNSDTGIFIWNKRPPTCRKNNTFNTRFSGKRTGYIRKNGYRAINIQGYGEYQCGRLAWLYTYGHFPKEEIDHVNLNKVDDRIENLREASRSQNATNRSTQSNNTTGYKGVWKRKGMDLWVAGVSKDGKNIKLGSFDCPQKAHAAYIAEITKMHGEFVRHE